MKRGFPWCLTCFLLLCAGPFCHGQAITIRIINGKNGQPVPKQHVSVSLLYRGSESKPAKHDAVQHLDTDGNGVARLFSRNLRQNTYPLWST